MPSTTKSMISAAASLAGSVMLLRSIVRDFVPPEIGYWVLSKVRGLLRSFSREFTVVIPEFDGLVQNQIFQAAAAYLGSIISANARRFRVTKPNKENKISTSMARNEEISDTFNGAAMKWKLVSRSTPTQHRSHLYDDRPVGRSENLSLELSFDKKHEKMVLETYLPYVLERYKELEELNKTLKLHTLQYERIYEGDGNPWHGVNLDHPATFDTLALDMEVKKNIMDDLDMFLRRKELYRRVGRAWKRGYLLFGPPGTGKSSLVAAMANHLNFDIYDLELTKLSCNSDLRTLLTSTANRSILVVEDIDCSLQLHDRLTQAKNRQYQTSKVSLSGVLNFIDGLWSSCGDERIIVFTTNHKDKLDPALLRPGRMDLHIHMAYCTPSGFRKLAYNYLDLTDHSLFPEVEELMVTAKVAPAEVAEQLMRHEEPRLSLQGLIKLLLQKKESHAEKAKKEEMGV